MVEENNIPNKVDFDGFSDFGVSQEYPDTDALPGSDGNSPEYDRIYNPQGENEYSNLRENPNQLEAIFRERRRARQHAGRSSALTAALQRVQYWPQMGRFITPHENTFKAHLDLVTNPNGTDLHFDPATYSLFDGVIAARANRPDVFDPAHPEYASYEPLRNNLAVLRNELMCFYMKDGAFDPADEQYIDELKDAAKIIGEAIEANKSLLSGLYAPLNIGLLNVEGEGAAHVYQFLVKHQTPDGLWGNIKAFVFRLIGQPDYQLHLPPIEESPFSQAALNAGYTHPDVALTGPMVAAEEAARFQEQPKKSVADLSIEDRNEAFVHGVTILEWLKNIKFSDKTLSEWMKDAPDDEIAEKTDAMARAVLMLDALVDAISQQDPVAVNSPQMQQAIAAKEAVTHSLALLAKLEKPVSMADTMQIGSSASMQPDRWDELSGQTVDRLMQTVTGGIEDALSALEQQQEDLDKGAEEQAVATNDMQMHGNAQRRRKRRRQAKSSSGAAQKKTDQALRADDRAAGQGIHADKKEQAPRARAAAPSAARSDAPATQQQQATAPDLAALMASNPELREISQKLNQASQQAAVAAAEQQRLQEEREPPKPLSEQTHVEREQQQPSRSKTDNKPKRG